MRPLRGMGKLYVLRGIQYVIPPTASDSYLFIELDRFFIHAVDCVKIK